LRTRGGQGSVVYVVGKTRIIPRICVLSSADLPDVKSPHYFSQPPPCSHHRKFNDYSDYWGRIAREFSVGFTPPPNADFRCTFPPEFCIYVWTPPARSVAALHTVALASASPPVPLRYTAFRVAQWGILRRGIAPPPRPLCLTLDEFLISVEGVEGCRVKLNRFENISNSFFFFFWYGFSLNPPHPPHTYFLLLYREVER